VAGSGRDHAPCTTSANCASGFECVGSPGQCRHYCCTKSCEGNAEFCALLPIVDTTIRVPVCVPETPCRLLNATTCAVGQTCTVVDPNSGDTSCVDIGKAQLGEDCNLEPCARDLACIGALGARSCYKLCHMDNSDAECPTGFVCKSNSTTFPDSSGIGICIHS
jgi:hypothetical protein